MSDRWLKPDFQEIAVAGECTAYAGTQDASETNARAAEMVSDASQKRRQPPTLLRSVANRSD